MEDLSRRGMLTGMPMMSAGLMGAGLLGAEMLSAAPAMAATPVTGNLADPTTRARVRARILGSVGTETTYMFYRLHIYGYNGAGNLVPFFTMNHLNISEWRPTGAATFQSKTYECGAYCRFNSDDPLEEWVNPITGEKRKVWQFYGGPFVVNVGADGISTAGADLKPDLMPIENMGGMVIVPTASGVSYPNVATPDKYPHLSSGPTTFWDSHACYFAKAEDAFNESLTSAPAFCQFQNFASWHPWLGMGGRADSGSGRTWGRAYGAKLKSLDDIPAPARRSLDKLTPEIFDYKNWTAPRRDAAEYLKSPLAR
ncbi:DUF1838 domain-containing protein [Novosphingobium sp. FSY-8]|uniref:DUF1838 domain-containing protein n=1 Tax=Novosphingobium ovatum TaxID=1908523 RepID=A0ABW9XBS1_9SPHN|nr:DUF1838 family protein [Novosphingobium ovatum]NBC35980.1 DUF1838 domain-containing protein [Novosphingobium ovatum]